MNKITEKYFQINFSMKIIFSKATKYLLVNISGLYPNHQDFFQFLMAGSEGWPNTSYG